MNKQTWLVALFMLLAPGIITPTQQPRHSTAPAVIQPVPVVPELPSSITELPNIDSPQISLIQPILIKQIEQQPVIEEPVLPPNDTDIAPDPIPEDVYPNCYWGMRVIDWGIVECATEADWVGFYEPWPPESAQ